MKFLNDIDVFFRAESPRCSLSRPAVPAACEARSQPLTPALSPKGEGVMRRSIEDTAAALLDDGDVDLGLGAGGRRLDSILAELGVLADLDLPGDLAEVGAALVDAQ